MGLTIIPNILAIINISNSYVRLRCQKCIFINKQKFGSSLPVVADYNKPYGTT